MECWHRVTEGERQTDHCAAGSGGAGRSVRGSEASPRTDLTWGQAQGPGQVGFTVPPKSLPIDFSQPNTRTVCGYGIKSVG